MAQSLVCLNAVTGAVKLEGGLAAQGAANARLLNGKGSSVVVRRNAMIVASVSSNEEEATSSSSRRSMLSLLAATVMSGAIAKEAGALTDIVLNVKIPPPSGGLPGTGNVDEASNTEIDLKKRFFLTSVEPEAAYKRVKEAADEIVAVKSLIDKNAWVYVQNALRSKAQYLGFDLKILIDSKAKPEKKSLNALKSKLFESINKLDYAARAKSKSSADKYYAETVDILGSVITKFA